MSRQITLATRQELTAVIRQRYSNADRVDKRLILDEFTKITGFHRKHAIRILTVASSPARERVCRHVCQEAANEALVVLWEAADRICGRRLKAAVPFLAATMDRRLRSIREQAYGGRKKKPAALNRVRRMVPVRTFADWGEQRPGYLEVDMVVHCGARAEGSFVHTLVLTDVSSGWTECIALLSANRR
jgi:hypothetical protein